jgi:hypothetical protein
MLNAIDPRQRFDFISKTEKKGEKKPTIFKIKPLTGLEKLASIEVTHAIDGGYTASCEKIIVCGLVGWENYGGNDWDKIVKSGDLRPIDYLSETLIAEISGEIQRISKLSDADKKKLG